MWVLTENAQAGPPLLPRDFSTPLAVSCYSLKHHGYPSITSALGQKTYFIPLHSEALRVEWDNQ